MKFDDIINEIIKNENYMKIAQDYHHGLNRFQHSLRVAKYTYKISKFLHFDYISATKAAILHDFFTNEEATHYPGTKIIYAHPIIAYENSTKYFDINEKEKNAIESHMFPLSKQMPKYKEAWVLSLVDKIVASYEFTRFKFGTFICLWFVFLFNMLTIGNR